MSRILYFAKIRHWCKVERSIPIELLGHWNSWNMNAEYNRRWNFGIRSTSINGCRLASTPQTTIPSLIDSTPPTTTTNLQQTHPRARPACPAPPPSPSPSPFPSPPLPPQLPPPLTRLPHPPLKFPILPSRAPSPPPLHNIPRHNRADDTYNNKTED